MLPSGYTSFYERTANRTRLSIVKLAVPYLKCVWQRVLFQLHGIFTWENNSVSPPQLILAKVLLYFYHPSSMNNSTHQLKFVTSAVSSMTAAVTGLNEPRREQGYLLDVFQLWPHDLRRNLISVRLVFPRDSPVQSVMSEINFQPYKCSGVSSLSLQLK